MDYKRLLKLHFINGFSSRAISESTKDGKTTINEFLKRFEECGELTWPLPDEVTIESDNSVFVEYGFLFSDFYSFRKASWPVCGRMIGSIGGSMFTNHIIFYKSKTRMN